MNSAKKKRLQQLARMMNKQSASPLYILDKVLEIFDLVITEEETTFLLNMGTDSYNRRALEDKVRLTEADFDRLFRSLIRKGILWSSKGEDGDDIYQMGSILFGWFEIYLLNGEDTPEKREFSRLLKELFQEYRKFNVFPVRNIRNLQMRFSRPNKHIVAIGEPLRDSGNRKTIDIGEEVNRPDISIYYTHTVNELIDRFGSDDNIAVGHCFCRLSHSMNGEKCHFDLPMESCLVIGKFTQHAIKYGMARPISREEAFSLISRLQKKGVVHQVFHDRQSIDEPEIAICNCCWDCCEVLRCYNQGITGLNLKCYYTANIQMGDKCRGCGLCVKFCPVAAIDLKDKTVTLNDRTCIGCGQCVIQCPHDVFSLHPEERTVKLPLKKPGDIRLPSRQRK